MIFKEVLEILNNDGKVRRRSWNNDIYLKRSNYYIILRIKLADSFSLYDGILQSDGWLLIGDKENQEYKFLDTVLFLLQGRKIREKNWSPDKYIESSSDRKSLVLFYEEARNFTPSFEDLITNEWEELTI